MTWRALGRIFLFTVAVLLVWACSYAIVSFKVAQSVSAERLAESEQELIFRMIEAGRDIKEIREAIESLNRRYDDGR